jgi:Zn-dependent peptidase ImmA (M78 family)
LITAGDNMNELLPINKDVFIWARTSIGLSIEDVAHKLNKTSQEIEEWEKGSTSPTYLQLEHLAHDIYKRPIAVFFFPKVPFEDSPNTSFRTLPDTVINELPPEMMKLYRRGKLFQLYLEELYEGQKPVSKLLLDEFELKENTELVSFVKAIRKELDISIEVQSKWHSPEDAFKKWRESLEMRGIFVFKDAFKNDAFSGFCLYDEKYPIIFVNNSMSHSRQVFTLFHELCHLLFHSGGIDFRSQESTSSFQGNYLDYEVSCNRFANEFLVPQDIFDSFPFIMSETHIQHLADIFSVSREVILRKYLDRKVVDKNYYEEMSAKWTDQARKQKEKGGRGNYYYNQKDYLGNRYISLVYGKYYQNKIKIDNVAEYLNVKVKNLPNFEYVVMEGGKLR